MQILKIGYSYLFKPNIIQQKKNSEREDNFVPRLRYNSLASDCVNFSANVVFSDNSFETMFPKNFFKKILAEGVTCAYTGVEMIPRSELDNMINSQVFRKKASVSFPQIKKYKNRMSGMEEKICTILEHEVKKHPDLKLQELLQLKYPMAEKALIRQQSAILDSISLQSRGMSKSDHIKVRRLISHSFDKIFSQDTMPENRFKRKEFIFALSDLDLEDKATQKKLLKEAEKLPQSSTSANAFIVKYSQNYKLKYNDGVVIKKSRDSEDLAIRLLKPYVATEDHIYPQERYRLEEIARQNGDKEAENLSKMKVTILTTDFINGEKGNILFDDFVKQSKYDIPANIQKHIDRLVEIAHKWANNGKIDDAKKLANYILILEEEFTRRSKIVHIDIEDFKNWLPELEQKEQIHKEKIKHKRLKKTGRADNSHSEACIDQNGHPLENRKIHLHICRFN